VLIEAYAHKRLSYQYDGFSFLSRRGATRIARLSQIPDSAPRLAREAIGRVTKS